MSLWQFIRIAFYCFKREKKSFCVYRLSILISGLEMKIKKGSLYTQNDFFPVCNKKSSANKLSQWHSLTRSCVEIAPNLVEIWLSAVFTLGANLIKYCHNLLQCLHFLGLKFYCKLQGYLRLQPWANVLKHFTMPIYCQCTVITKML